MDTKQKSKELTKRINLLYNEMFSTSSAPQRKPPISEILPWLFLGSCIDAKDIEKLSTLQIKYVLNLAHSKKDGNLYIPHGIAYKGINADDRETYDIQQHFDETFNFIMEAMNSNSNILVHCRRGVSRSATIVIAFLARYTKQQLQEDKNKEAPVMVENLNSLEDVTKFVFQRRNSICPNMGFMKQLFAAYETW